MSKLNIVKLSSLLRNCVPLHAIKQAKQTHTQILVNGFFTPSPSPSPTPTSSSSSSVVTLQTDLLLVYSRCTQLQEAHQVFQGMIHRNMHSWNILISSYVQNSLHFEALTIFYREILNKMDGGLQPDHFTFPSIFKACAGIKYCLLGKNLHSWVIKLGFQDHVVVGTSILDFYMKCGNLIDAQQVFVNMTHRKRRRMDIVVWNSMISGFVRAGFSVQALVYFRKMQEEEQGVEMDTRTIPSILIACGREGDLMKGKEIHAQILKKEDLLFSRDVAIGNSLIDMYAKCGCLYDSKKVFQVMPELNLVSWTTLISCHGVHGNGEESLILFEKMRAVGFKPNCVTLTAVLASCSHSGLIEQGRKIFDSMTSNYYGFKPSIEHYACMVDLLGRFGHLEDALGLINKMPEEPTSSIWGALLGACRIHKNVEIGEVAAGQLFELEAQNSSNYITLCNIYESVGRWDGVLRIRSRMRELGLVKLPGCSWINIKGRVYRFFKGDISHPMTKMVYETLDGMIKDEMAF